MAKSMKDRLHLIGNDVNSFGFGLYVLQMCLAFQHPMGLSLSIYVLEYFIAP